MPSTGSQPFRYAETPSKVLHFRNLPWECTEEKLIEHCKPFGGIIYAKCNVGSNSNQAFIESVDLNEAISMASYYASSFITIYKGPGDVLGNVLLVTMGAVELNDTSIDVITVKELGFNRAEEISSCTFQDGKVFRKSFKRTDGIKTVFKTL